MWPKLPIPDVLGWLLYLFCGLEVCMLGWTLWRRKRKVKMNERGLTFIHAMLVSAFVLSVLIYRGLTYVGSPSHEIHHHIYVLKHVDTNKWLMRDDESGQTEYLYTGCADFNNEGVIWAGYIADHATWNDYGNCKSISGAEQAFVWLRDEN